MKTYCKDVDITDVDFIVRAIYSYISDKCKKNNTIMFYCNFAGKRRKDVQDQINPYSEFFMDTTKRIAEEMSFHIKNRTVRQHLGQKCFGEPIIRYLEITDVGSGKKRDLGLECLLFRFYEVVANVAADPLFTAKVGEFQVASIKGRGQKYGKHAIVKWLSTDPDGTKYGCQADVKKCYPSIPHDKLRAMFQRDIRKAHDLLYLFDTILDLYEEYPNPKAEDPKKGILIGSPVSKDMCNYYMSKLYHYACENIFKEKTRRGKAQRTRLISHILIYMDDIQIYGANKKDIQKAMEMIVSFARDEMGLTVKPSWRKFLSMYKGKDGQTRGCLLDFMGFRFHGGAVMTRYYYGRPVKYREVWVTIRARTFVKARRKFSRFVRMVKRKEIVSEKFAKSLTSYYGCFKQTNSATFRQDNRIDKTMRIARKVVSNYAKGKPYKVDTYYKMWRRYCA